MEKVVVTGGAGFVGNRLVQVLCDKDCDVTVLDDGSIGNNRVSDAVYVQADINEIDSLGYDFDTCFHLAGKSRIQPSFDNPLETFRVNTMGTTQVMEWARKSGAKVVYAGSSSRHHDPYLSPYAGSKWLGEEVCKIYRNVYDVDVSVVRFYNVYGPEEITNGQWAAVIGKWRGNIQHGEPIGIVGDGEQRRDFTHVDDIVGGLLLAAQNLPHDDAWELGNGENYSINEIAAMFQERFSDVEIQYIDNQPGNYRETLRTNDDARTMLGWRPQRKLENYIQEL